MKFTALKPRKAETLIDELERVQRQITQRAYDMFRRRGASLGAALDDWLAAERQTLWKPAIEVCEHDNTIVIEAGVAGIEPRELDIQVTPETLLVKADVMHGHPEKKGTVHVCEFATGQLFRLVQLPVRIDPDNVTAECRNGLLRITAPIARPKPVRTVDVTAS